VCANGIIEKIARWWALRFYEKKQRFYEKKNKN
jgi:hypothetical protein